MEKRPELADWGGMRKEIRNSVEVKSSNQCFKMCVNVNKTILYKQRQRTFSKITVVLWKEHLHFKWWKAECVFILLDDLQQNHRSVKASNEPLIAGRPSEPPAPQQITSCPSCDYLVSALFVLAQLNRTLLFLVTEMTGSANYVEMTILK